MSEYTVEGDESMRWDVISDDSGPVGSWVVKVPVVDRQGVVVEWRPKGIIPQTSEREALRIARAEHWPKADIWLQ